MANRIKRNSNVLPTKIEVVSHSIDENGIKNLPNGETPIFSPEIPKTNEESSKFAPSNFLKRDQSLPQSMYDLDKSYSSNFLYQLEAVKKNFSSSF